MDDLSILLKATLDVNKSVDNINKQILQVQDKLKNVNISLNISDFKNELEKVFGTLESKVKSTKEQKLEFQGLSETTKQIKELSGSLENIYKDLKKVGDVKSLKNIYDTDGNVTGFNLQLEKIMGNLKEVSNYNVFGQYNKDTKEYEYALTKVNSTLKEIDNSNKKINENNKKSSQMTTAKNLQAYYDNARKYALEVEKGAMDATEALKKLETVMFKSDKSGFTWQFDGLSAQQQKSILSDRNKLENQILQSKKAQYNVEKQIEQSQDKQTANVIKQVSTIKEMNSKLSSLTGKYGSSVDSNELSRIKAMISELEKLNPATKTYAARVTETNKAIATLTRNSADGFKKTQDAISDTTSKTSQLGLAMRTLGQLFMVGSPIYLAQQVFRDMATSVNEVNKALTDIRIVTGISGKEALELRDSYNELGRAIGATTNEMLTGATEWFRQGKTIAETQDLITASITGAKLAGVESAQMSEYLTATLNGFQLSSEKAMNVIDKMVAVDNAAATSVTELSVAMQQTAASAQLAGVNIDELLGYIGTVSSVTRRSAEVVGQSFKTIFSRFQNIKLGEFTDDGVVASDVIKAMDAVKIKVMENETTFRDFGDVIQELSTKWATLNQAEQISIANAMAGVRQRESFLVLMNNMSEANKLTELSMDSAGLATNRFNTYLESTEAKLNKFKATAEAVFMETLSSSTINSMIQLGIVTLEFVDNAGGLVPVLTTILGLIVAIKSASISSWLSSVTASILATSKAMMGVKVATDATAVSATRLQAALGWIGLAGIALTALHSGIKYLSEETERAEKQMAGLNDEIKTLSNNKVKSNDLAKQYEEIKKIAESQKLTNEQQKEFIEIQNNLKDIMPEINGYYDEQGNFIITETDLVGKLVDVYDDLILKKRQEKSETAQGLMSDLDKGIAEQKEKIEDAKKNIELYYKYLNGEDLSGAKLTKISNDMEEYGVSTVDALIDSVDKEINNLQTAMNKSFTGMRQNILDQMFNSDEWNRLGDEYKQAISEFVNNLSQSELETYFGMLLSGSNSVDELVVKMKDMSRVQDIVNESSSDSITTLSNTSEALDKASKSMSDYQDELDSMVSKSNSYKKILEELNENHGLASDSIAEIAKNYPELLAFMDDESTLRQKLIDEISTQDAEITQAYQNMLNSSEEYYQQRIIGDTEMYSQLTSLVDSYFNGLDQGYVGDLADYKNLESAKLDLTKQLIEQLANMWKQYWYQSSQGVGFDKTRFLKEAIGKGMTQDEIGKAMKEMENAEYQIKKMMDGFDDIVSGVTFNPLNLSVGSKKSSGSKKEKDPIVEEYKNKLDEISSLRTEVESKIAELQEAINLDELLGVFDEDKANKMSILKDELRGISEIQIDKFNGLAQIYKDTEQLGELEKLIADARKQDYIDEHGFISHTIDLINKRYESEKRSYEDKIRDINLQQMMVKEDSQEYLSLEEQKVDALLQLQQSYLEKVRQLKETGLSQESEEVRKYVDMYYNAEEEILNMQKAIAEKTKEIKLQATAKTIEQYEEQKKAQQDIFETTMKMIKAEHETRKKAIQDEIKGYERIINAKKESLRDEYDKENAADELAEKQKVLEGIEKQLLILDGVEGEDAKAKRLKLEEEKAKAIKDIDKFNREQLLKSQEDMLDKELENFKDEKQQEIDEIDDYISKESNIREEALKRMDKKNKALYEQLKKYSNDYTSISGDEFDKMWSLATQSIEGYTDKNMTLLDTMKLVTEELEKQKQLQSQATDSSWKDHVPSGNVGGSQTNKNVKVIQQMMENSSKWSNSSDAEKKRLADENQKLGRSIGAYHDSATGEWYLDSTKKKKLYQSILGTFHTGLQKGQIGTGLKPHEAIVKATKDEWIFTNDEMKNLTHNLNGVMQQKQQGMVLHLNIEKLIEVDKLDNNVDVKGIVNLAVKETVKQVNYQFRKGGF